MWRDIETAPKDGTEILAWGRYSLRPQIVRWHKNDWYETTESGLAISSMTDFGIEYMEAGPLTVRQPIPEPPPKQD